MIQSTRGNGHKLKYSEHQETLLHSESNQALASVAQGGCRVSILQDIQNLSGHGPEHVVGLLEQTDSMIQFFTWIQFYP